MYDALQRLEPTTDVEERKLVHEVFAGGEKLNMNLDSSVVIVGDIDLSVRSIQTLDLKFLVNSFVMDAFMELCEQRDVQLCDAYRQVNESSRVFSLRLTSHFMKSNTANVLLDVEKTIESTVSNTLVQSLIVDKVLLRSYRTIVPYFWGIKNEWILIVLESCIASASSMYIHFVYLRYSDDVVLSSTLDERVGLNLLIKERLEAVLSAHFTVIDRNNSDSVPVDRDKGHAIECTIYNTRRK